MDIVLPSSVSVYDKTQGFQVEALEFRDALFTKRMTQLKVLPESQEMLTLLKAQTERARLTQTTLGNAWRGEAIRSIEEEELKAETATQKRNAEHRITQIVDELAANNVHTVKVDIALGEHAEVLVAYATEGQQKYEPDIEMKMARFLNDCLFAENTLVTQDSTIFQAESLDRLLTDSNGNLIPGEREQIEQSFRRMRDSLAEKGIKLEINDDYDYATVRKALDAAVPAPEVTPAVEPHVPEAPRSKPDMG